MEMTIQYTLLLLLLLVLLWCGRLCTVPNLPWRPREFTPPINGPFPTNRRPPPIPCPLKPPMPNELVSPRGQGRWRERRGGL